MDNGGRGWPFVGWMIVAVCAVSGLAALVGVPAGDVLFFGAAGMLMGICAARLLVPRRDWGLAGKTILTFVAIGGIFVGSYLSVLDFSTIRGTFFWGLYLGFWPATISGLTDPPNPHRPEG